MSEHRKWAFRLDDMMDCIHHIERISSRHRDEVEFHADLDAYRAVERNFEIIAEASKHIPDEVKAQFPDMQWADMIGMRNIISHNYDGVDEVVLWSAIQLNIPRLKQVVAALLEQYGDR